MYSDSSSTTESSENSDTFPGHRQIAQAHHHTVHGHWMGEASNRLLQQYKGQLKLAVYVNYGLITVHVVMGKHLKSKLKANCNSYVKLAITPDESRRTRCKTDLFPDSNSPVYDEKFSFELLEADMDKRLFVSLWNKHSAGNACEFLGCMSFGIRHIYNQSKTVSGWHYLLPGDVGKRKHLLVSEPTGGRALSDRQVSVPNGRSNIPPIREDMIWNETHTITVRRGARGGYGFTICGSAPVCVRRLEAGSHAEGVGLRPGDRIIKIDGVNMTNGNADSLARVIKHSARQVVLEIQRPRQMDTAPPMCTPLDQSPRRRRAALPPSQSTPERVGVSGSQGHINQAQCPPGHSPDARGHAAMDAMDGRQISPWRVARGNGAGVRRRQRPYPQMAQPAQDYITHAQSIPSHVQVIPSHAQDASDTDAYPVHVPRDYDVIEAGNAYEDGKGDEPIYEEPDFGKNDKLQEGYSDADMSIESPGVGHYDYGWVDGRVSGGNVETNKENHRLVGSTNNAMLPPKVPHAHSVDGKMYVRAQIESVQTSANYNTHARTGFGSSQGLYEPTRDFPRSVSDSQQVRYASGTLPRNMKFNGGAVTRQTQSARSLKDYGWLDGESGNTGRQYDRYATHQSQQGDYGGSLSSGYASGTGTSLRKTVPFQSSKQTNV